ncbi:hypothetical protein ACFPVY_10785 [Flavobacterium qiangtangense]|uniref:Uncharacterized protein n=1 Tax=Flavobacterium qiangtangense TaxID=1442595 RepID=A0ABW1PPG4_9FLAO
MKESKITKEYKKEIDSRLEKLLDENLKLYTWEEVKQKIAEARKDFHSKF